MVLTMTRTRTQTTLTKLASMVANTHGELAFVERLLDEARAEVASVDEHAVAVAVPAARTKGPTAAERAAALVRRRDELLRVRESLYATVRQFDPGLDPTDIGSDDAWLKKFGRGGGPTSRKRYAAALSSALA